MIKLLELFGGIGACSKAFERLGIEHEIVDYVEIDKYAVKSFNAVHRTNFEPQDITKWNKDIDVDFIMHGSPCQDFSVAGKGKGGDEGSGTRSSLMYETIRIVSKLKPKYVLWENVKNLLSKKHIHNFRNYISTMNGLGYNSYYQVLNSKDYGIPQNRERVFTLSIRQDIDNGTFTFPKPMELELKLKDMLENEVDEKYFLNTKWHYTTEKEQKHDINEIGQIDNCSYKAIRTITDTDKVCRTIDTMTGGQREPKIIVEMNNKRVKLNIEHNYSDIQENSFLNSYNNTVNNTGVSGTITTGVSFRNETHIAVKSKLKQKLCDELIDNNMVKENDMIRHSYTNWRMEQEFHTENSENNNISATLTTRPDTLGIAVKTKNTQDNKGVVLNDLRIRKLTPKECWRLMGFNDSDFEKAEKVNSNAQLYKQAGNRIVVNVLERILENLFLKTENDFEGQVTFEMLGGNK